MEKQKKLLHHYCHISYKGDIAFSISKYIFNDYSASDDRANIEQQAENRRQCVYIVGTHTR